MPPTPRQFTPLKDRPKLSTLKDSHNICYYGREGTTKTTNALTMANHGRVILVNAESNAKRAALKRRGINVDNITIWPDVDAGEEISFNTLKNLYFALKADIVSDPGYWYGITLDSVTEIIRILISNSRHDEFKRKQGTDKARAIVYKEEWDDFNFAKVQIMELLRDFRSLPIHMAFTALELRDKEGLMGPAANPAMMEHLPGFASILVHCVGRQEDPDDPDTLVYAGHTVMHGPKLDFRGKDSLGCLPRVLPEPTFTRILGYAEGELTKENDPVRIALRDAARARKARTTTITAPTTNGNNEKNNNETNNQTESGEK